MYLLSEAKYGYNISKEFRKSSTLISDPRLINSTLKKDWSRPEAIENLVTSMYSSKRLVSVDGENYENGEKYKSLYDAQKSNKHLEGVKESSQEDQWVRKFGSGYFEDKKTSKEETHRFILNVTPSEELFEELDNFAEKYRCEYKTPNLKDWNERADTAIIYTKDQRVAEQLEELKPIVEKHLRTSLDADMFFDGTKKTDGLYIAKEKKKEEVLDLFNEINPLFPSIGANIKNKVEKSPSRKHPLSLGEFGIYKTIIDNYKQLKQNVSEKSKDKNQEKETPTKESKSYDYKEMLDKYSELKYGDNQEVKTDDKINAFEKFKIDFKRHLPTHDFDLAFSQNPKDVYLTVDQFQNNNKTFEEAYVKRAKEKINSTDNKATKLKYNIQLDKDLREMGWVCNSSKNEPIWYNPYEKTSKDVEKDYTNLIILNEKKSLLHQ